MAIIQYAKRTIDSKIEELINDNTSKDISAADVRSIVKDYVTNSTYAPVMIYAGILKRRSGSGSDNSIIEDYYYNSEYFNQQSENSPMATGNIVQLSAVGAPGTANGTYTQRYGDVSSGTGDLLLEYTVSSNVITNLKFKDPRRFQKFYSHPEKPYSRKRIKIRKEKFGSYASI